MNRPNDRPTPESRRAGAAPADQAAERLGAHPVGAAAAGGGASAQPTPGAGPASAEQAAAPVSPSTPSPPSEPSTLDDPDASAQDLAPRGVPPRPGG